MYAAIISKFLNLYMLLMHETYREFFFTSRLVLAIIIVTVF